MKTRGSIEGKKGITEKKGYGGNGGRWLRIVGSYREGNILGYR